MSYTAMIILFVGVLLLIVALILVFHFWIGCTSCTSHFEITRGDVASATSQVTLILHPNMPQVIKDINTQYAQQWHYPVSTNASVSTKYVVYMGPNAMVLPSGSIYNFDDVVKILDVGADVAICRETIPRTDDKWFNTEVIVARSTFDVSTINNIVEKEFKQEKVIESISLDKGYPSRGERCVMFHQNAFNGMGPFILNLDNVSQSLREKIFDGRVDVQMLTRFSINSAVFPLVKDDIDIATIHNSPNTTSLSQKIPKVIYQTFNSCAIPKIMKECLDTWIVQNPDYEYIFFDDCLCRKFLIGHFDPRVIKAYDDLIPGAFKADLWRYCVLYIKGGVYVDAKTKCIIPLRDVIRSDDECILVRDRDSGLVNFFNMVYNAFMCITPRHPLLRDVIDDVLKAVENRDYGESILDITGPKKIGRRVYSAISTLREKSKCVNVDSCISPLDVGTYDSTYGKIRLFDHCENENNEIHDDQGRFIVHTRYRTAFMESGFLNSITGKKHYMYYWLAGKVFRD